MHLHASSDESPDLPRWATITQVSSALLVPRTTVRGAVRRALAEGELWVRRADADDEHSPYLIDTTHPTYLAHVQRWQENQTMTEEAEEDVRGRLDLDPFPSVQHALGARPFSSSLSARRQADEVLSRWSYFRERLCDWGIQIFQNILGDEDDWQWRWGELHGEGYPSEEEAIVAALESRLAPADASPILPPSALPLTSPPTRRASLQPNTRPFWLFPRRRRRFF